MPSTAVKKAKLLHSAVTQSGFTFKAYRGCGSVMLTFNLEDHLTDNLAGFAIRRTGADGKSEWLMNRLSFDFGYTSKSTAKDRKWTPSNEAPFQKFWWVDFPPTDEDGTHTYTATVIRFDGSKLVPDQTASLPVELGPFIQGDAEIGFTRGYLSSQAFAEKVRAGEFKAEICPKPKTIDYDTNPYQAEYKWLGFEARRMIFQFLDECLKENASIDVFAYDDNEPDFVRQLQKFGDKLRIIQDNSKEHTGDKALEPDAVKLLQDSAGTDNVVVGKFGRYAHDKIIIKKVGNKPVKVLTGSTNFSITGIYVNANNVLLFNDENVAALYEQVFEAAFQGGASKAKFEDNTLSKKEFEFTSPNLPHMFISFAPHANSDVSLKRVLREIKKANSSVLFAVMQMTGSGDVLKTLRDIHADPKVFSYGVSDSPGGATVFKPDQAGGILVPTPALTKNVPPPFLKEFTDGAAHRVHHKFVVVDFNDSDPVLFTGSSNLADGGEENNGDNLLAIYDREIASAYAVEAVRLIDHYAFRAAMQKATEKKPLQLSGNNKGWWSAYYDPKSMKYKERLLFSR